MKTQTFGALSYILPYPPLLTPVPQIINRCLADYKDNRENGDERFDKPYWDFPEDGKYAWAPEPGKPGYYRAHYAEGPKDRQWMEERDRHYVFRLEQEGTLDVTEPKLQSECPKLYAEVMAERARIARVVAAFQRLNSNNNNNPVPWAAPQYPPQPFASIPIPAVPVAQSTLPVDKSTPTSPSIPATPTPVVHPIPTLPAPSLSGYQTIARTDLVPHELIGSGGFGEVYRATWHGQNVALKQLHLKHMTTNVLDDFKREADLMAKLHFPNIVSLYGVCLETGHYAMVMEYLPKGSLYHVLHDPKETLSWSPTRWQIATEIGQGLSYLHGQNPPVLHRDLKSLNVLLDRHYHAKISDFGLSKLKLETNSTTTVQNKAMGSTRWRAPELFARRASATQASDVYSYGMILWEIASRALPFNDASDDQTVISWIKDNEQEDMPSDCPSAYADIIQKCWLAANARPSASEVVTLLQQATPSSTTTTTSTSTPKSWHFDPQTKDQYTNNNNNNNAAANIIDALPSDCQKVAGFYAHHPVPGYDIKSVQVIYNPLLNRSFSVKLQKLENREQQKVFAPTWQQESHPTWRQAVHDKALELAQPYIDPDYPNVKIIPLWHGTKPEVLSSLIQTGYANLATTDPGFFGKGIYSTYEAEYAYRVYSKGGTLLVNWVAFYSAYPVIAGDQTKLASGNYSNYDAHFVPVVPKDPNNPNEVNYHPTQPNQTYQYTEVVVFESDQCLPRYVVELQPSLPQTPPGLLSSAKNQTLFGNTQQQQQQNTVNQQQSTITQTTSYTT